MRRGFPLYDELMQHRSHHAPVAATLGAPSGLIGSLLAMEVIHWITGISEPATLGRGLVSTYATSRTIGSPWTRTRAAARLLLNAPMDRTTTLGAAFARALAEKDAAGIRELIHPDIDFRGLTPNRSWEANDRDELLSILLESWFEEDDEIEALESVESDTVADRERVGYRFSVSNPDGRHLVEQRQISPIATGRLSGCGWSARASARSSGALPS